MEVELGLKITRTKDDVSSSRDFQVVKDSFGRHLSLSRETNSVFILTLHLKGFKKDGVDIEINKEGNRIKISGRKQVQEMVLVKWVEWKKETEVKEFKKVFRIPDIVNLDKIKAKLNEEDGTLTVTMPKKIKGITGLKIEEEEEEEEEEKTEPVVEEKTEEKTEPEEEIKEELKPEVEEEEEEEEEEPQREVEEDKIEEEVVEEETRDHDEEKKEEVEDKPRKKRRKKFRLPCFAGSTLLMSIIVFIIQLIQSRKK
ncbi:PREDICTED: gelsolin-related protein of 125 kDa [Camelina sativa]|uniref:Gelsolin-related protein of 125 kDa n=1 Tax=Camelina sativa TaxID=90675 RepID=A0ABM0TN12_CAMSA|nr:PREDICTED: gelsolin-related protein of 125 kDa [Camelina sativa]